MINSEDDTTTDSVNKKQKKKIQPENVEVYCDTEVNESSSNVIESKSTLSPAKENKEKLKTLVHPTRIKPKKPQKMNLKLISKGNKKTINFF